MFVEQFDDAGSKAGWCLYKMGCRGPVTYNSCGNMRWWQGLSYPIQAGSPCIGCANDGFWDNGQFLERLPNVATPNTISNADKIGLTVAGATLAGIGVHAAASVVRHSQDTAKKDNSKDVSKPVGGDR
jgi:hydrogenase small subunit